MGIIYWCTMLHNFTVTFKLRLTRIQKKCDPTVDGLTQIWLVKNPNSSTILLLMISDWSLITVIYI